MGSTLPLLALLHLARGQLVHSAPEVQNFEMGLGYFLGLALFVFLLVV
jgi:hypothetical protein